MRRKSLFNSELRHLSLFSGCCSVKKKKKVNLVPFWFESLARLSELASLTGSCWLQLENVVIGRRGEKKLLFAGGAVVAGSVAPQCPLKVQQLTHEVEVGRNVGLLPLDKVVGIVQGEVESLHQVGHCDRDGAADAGQAVDQDATALGTSLVWKTTRVQTRVSLTPLLTEHVCLSTPAQ